MDVSIYKQAMHSSVSRAKTKSPRAAWHTPSLCQQTDSEGDFFIVDKKLSLCRLQCSSPRQVGWLNKNWVTKNVVSCLPMPTKSWLYPPARGWRYPVVAPVALYLNRLLWKTEHTGTAEGDAKGDETGKKGDEKAERWQ